MNRIKSTIIRLRSWCTQKVRAASDIVILVCMLVVYVLHGLWKLCVAASRRAVRLPIWLRRRSPRMTIPAILSGLLVLAVASIAPHQFPVLLYKLAAPASGGCLGYLLDVTAFPYAKPSGYLRYDWRGVESFEDDEPDFGIVPGYMWAFLFACGRRVFIMSACTVAMAQAL